MKRYSESLEQWEQEAYLDGYGADWLADVGYAAFSQDGYRAFFWLKRKGLDWLGEKLDMHIYDEEN